MHCDPYIDYTDPLFVKAVKDVVKIPVICKLMAIKDNPGKVGCQVEAAGADAITGLGTFGFRSMEIDVENARPYMGNMHGLGGTWLRAVSLAYMADVRKNVSIPLSGVTGVANWEDAVKYILIGCSTVQVCAAIYARGYKVLTEIADGIDGYIKRYGYKSVEDFRGKALANMTAPEYAPPVKAKVMEDKCIACGACLDSCLFDALGMKDGVASISDKCDGCGVCWSLCPQNAIEMIRF